MLTRKILKYLKLGLFLTKLSRSAIWEWDSDKEVHMRVNETRWARFHCFLSFLLMVAHEGFLVWRLLGTVLFPSAGKNLQGTINLCYNVCVYATPLTLHFLFYVHLREIPAFINGYIAFYARFKELFVLPNFRRAKNGCETLLKAFYWAGLLITLQNIVAVLRAPQREYLLTSLFVDTKGKLAPKIKIPFLILYLQIWCNIWSQLLFAGTIIYAYVFPALTILRNLQVGYKYTRTYDVLRSPHEFKRMYRKLAVLQNMFNFCFRYSFFPFHKILISLVAVFGIYGTIRIHGPRKGIMIILALTTTLHLSVIFRQLGRFYQISQGVLGSWKGRGQSTKKFLQSCQPLRVDIADSYYVVRSTVLVLFGVIVNVSITLLLSS